VAARQAVEPSIAAMFLHRGIDGDLRHIQRTTFAGGDRARPGFVASTSSPSHETGEQATPGGDHFRLGEYALGTRPVGGAEGSPEVAPNREAG
jgi:hypothetical protein